MQKRIKDLFVEIYVPLMWSWFRTATEKQKAYVEPKTKKAITQIIKYSDKKIKLFDPLSGQIPISISIINEPTYISTHLKYYYRNNTLLKIQFDYRFNYTKFLFHKDLHNAKEDQIRLAQRRFQHRITRAVQNLIVAVNLAVPGGLSTSEGIMLINGEIVSAIEEMHSVLNEMHDLIEHKKWGWPRFKTLDILKVWNYLLKNNYTFNSYSKNTIEKALYCFSYLFGDINNTEEHLIYSMMGIEAIYAQGNTGLSEQIDNKCQLFLGKLNEFKKLLRQMYDFRSRYLHGDLNIPPKHLRWNDDYESTKYEDDFHDSTILSAAILTATLQKLLDKGAEKLSFEYKYRLK